MWKSLVRSSWKWIVPFPLLVVAACAMASLPTLSSDTWYQCGCQEVLFPQMIAHPTIRNSKRYHNSWRWIYVTALRAINFFSAVTPSHRRIPSYGVLYHRCSLTKSFRVYILYILNTYNEYTIVMSSVRLLSRSTARLNSLLCSIGNQKIAYSGSVRFATTYFTPGRTSYNLQIPRRPLHSLCSSNLNDRTVYLSFFCINVR